MIVKNNSKQHEIKQNMRGGKGDIKITHITDQEVLGKHCRLFAQITVKPGDSIGDHQHVGEQATYMSIGQINRPEPHLHAALTQTGLRHKQAQKPDRHHQRYERDLEYRLGA